MKVILLQDIENIGKKYEVKEVKNGYARNFLIPKDLVKPATKQALKWLEAQKEILEENAEIELKKVQEMVSNIDGQEIMISVKVGDKGQFFEKIDEKDIIIKIKEMGFDIKKNQVELENPIEELGEFPVKIKFQHNLEAELKVIITEEKS
ncbi:MAG: 50S ribosomal protein L9 [Candidatus Nealsonbacteria bacterium]